MTYTATLPNTFATVFKWTPQLRGATSRKQVFVNNVFGRFSSVLTSPQTYGKWHIRVDEDHRAQICVSGSTRYSSSCFTKRHIDLSPAVKGRRDISCPRATPDPKMDSCEITDHWNCRVKVDRDVIIDSTMSTCHIIVFVEVNVWWNCG